MTVEASKGSKAETPARFPEMVPELVTVAVPSDEMPATVPVMVPELITAALVPA